MSELSRFINRFNIVKQIPIFSKLNWFDMQKIARKAVLTDYKKGDLISQEGTPPDFFYCLISGRLQAYTLSPNGSKKNVDFIHRGMPFGIISILTGENHSLNFEALNDSIVLKIEQEEFKRILKEIPQLGIEFSHTLSTRIRGNITGAKKIFENKIISIYSTVKGAGSSTYAINLALSLKQETKKKVIFVDLHSANTEKENLDSVIGHTEAMWKLPPVKLSEIVDDHQKIHESITKSDQHIDLLNVTFDPDNDTLKSQIGQFVSAFAGDYHYVVVDLPSDMDDVILETLTQSDLVHLITSDHRKDLQQVRHVIDCLEGNLKERFLEDKIKVIIRAAHDKIYLSFEEIDKFIDYSVYKMLPKIHAEELIQEIDAESFTLIQCDEKSEYAKVVKRIAREIGNVLVGLVLGGGAALGVAHVGVIRVLEQENIPIDIVVGSSMGALIAGLWVSGKNADELEEVAREFEKPLNMIKLWDPAIIRGLIGGRRIKSWLKKHLGNSTFYHSRIPLKIVAYDLRRREEIVINSGSLADAIRKSIAIPGVIRPVVEKDRTIIDGGVLNPLPTNVLSSLGIKKIIAVNVLQSPEDVSLGYDVYNKRQREKMDISPLKLPLSFLWTRIVSFILLPFRINIADIIIQTLQASEYVIAEQSAQQADINIHPDLVGLNWYDLSRVDELVKSGENAVREVLPKIKELAHE